MRFWPTFTGAFYSPHTYAQVRAMRGGWGFTYTFTLVAITTLLGVVMLSVTFHQYAFTARDGHAPLVDRAIVEIAQQLPPFVLDRGTLKTDTPAATIITLKVDGQEAPVRLFTIDTSGATTSATMRTYVLVNATHVISRRSDGTITQRPLAELTRDHPYLEARSHEDIMEGAYFIIDALHANLWKLYAVLVPLAWLLMTVIFFITRVFMLLALGGMAMAMGSVHGARASYVDSVRLACVAYTPVATFSAVAFMAGFTAIGSAALFAMGTLMVLCAISVTKDAT